MKKHFCINFTRWKQKHIHSFLGAYSQNTAQIEFISDLFQAEKKGFDSQSQLITWSSKNQDEVVKIAKKWGGVFWSMEDGFIRSTGLGTDLTAPASLVLDKTGIYYDHNHVSDLETLLQTKQFDSEELHRAELLKKSLLENELSKYNLGQSFNKSQLNIEENQIIVLIPGQVEDDASIKKGCVDINTNAELIKSARKNKPEAFLIYKPHPDVVSGNRKGNVDNAITGQYVDLVLHDVSITDCLEIVDEVHTMTSLVGFEGLLRNLKVVCYGIPFYAGWGLTQDRHSVERRSRKLELNQLVHATLIDYPLYMDWQTKTLTTPEVVIQQLAQQIAEQGGKQSNQVSPFVRVFRKVKNYITGVFFSA